MDGMREALRPFYSSLGRPSIDPELIIRMLVIGYVIRPFETFVCGAEKGLDHLSWAEFKHSTLVGVGYVGCVLPQSRPNN